MGDRPSITDAAQAYLSADLCALPAIRAEKRPAVGRWKQYQTRMPTPAELSAWLANPRGRGGKGPDAVCILCGRASGNVEAIDFDAGGELFSTWWDRIPADLRDRLVVEITPSGGRHVIYRCVVAISGNLKLAQRKADGKVVTLIETRGEGGLILCAPTAGYEIVQGDLCDPPRLTEADRDVLLRAAWELNEYRPPVVDGPTGSANVGQSGAWSAENSHSGGSSPENGHRCDCPSDNGHGAPVSANNSDIRPMSADSSENHHCATDSSDNAACPSHNSHNSACPSDNAHNPPLSAEISHSGDCPSDMGKRPGDDFNRRGDVRAVLEQFGWSRVRGGQNEYWRRPGKTSGWSATFNGEHFYVFSSNAAPFEPNQPYSPFAVYTLLHHGGDFEQAARCLRELGFGGDGSTDNASDTNISAIVRMSVGPGDCPSDNGDCGPSLADDSDNPPSRPGVADPGPFLEDLFDVPGFIGDVVRHTLSIAHRYQPVLALAGAIMLQAVLAARKVRDERGNRTNLYAIGVALSSAGKDKPREVNDRILELADVDLLGNEEVTSDAAVLTAVEARPAILFQFDEFGRFLRTMGDPRKSPNIYSAVTTLMRLYSNANRTYRGKGYADAKRNKVIVQPCACIYGTSTPRSMYESLTKEGIEDGFVGRLIFFETMTRPPRVRHPEADPPEHLIETAKWWNSYVPHGGNTENVYPKPRLVEATDEANAIFDALAELSDAEMERDETYAPIWGRAEEKACRLALVYACSRCKEEPAIDADAANWACRLAEYTTRRTVFTADQWIAEGLFDARQKKVLRVIRKAGVISRSKLCHQTQSLTPKERAEVLDNLIQTDQIRIVQVETRGRHRTDYQAM